MKILVLTPISPAHSGVAYSRIANHFQKNKKVDTLSISVFADIQARMENKEFLPNFFAMLQGSEIQKTKYRLYLNHYTIMVGNIYKSHKFDYIISLGHDNEEIFDLYLEELRTNPEADEFNTKARIEDLYSPEDAELNVPTIDHAIKFIEEVIKNDELNRQQFRDNAKRKTKKAVNSKEEKMVIIAPAGSGKTTVLIEAIKVYMEEYPLDNIVAITFTRKAAGELSQRLGYTPRVSVSTIHSWALRELEDLSMRIAKNDPTKSFKVKLLEEQKIKEILKDIAHKRKYYYVNIDIMYNYVMGNYQMDISDAMRQIFNTCLDKYVEFKRKHGLYDFTDLPEYLLDKLNDYGLDLEHIDALFVDEFQDVDDVQIELFERVLAKKKLFIGDPKQCQPAGTKVRLSNGEQKNIEDLVVGDRVISYMASESYITGCKNAYGYDVLEKVERDFVNDYLITIETENGKVSRYTPNHITYAAIRSDNKLNEVVYLMENQEGRFRIGTSQLYVSYASQDMSTFRHKMMSEGYKNAWILKLFDNSHDARALEAKLSFKYGIPQTTFQEKKSGFKNEDLDFIYEDIDTFERSKKLLKDLKLDIRYPFLSKEDRKDLRRDAFRKIYAINLIPEVMSALTHDHTQPTTKRKNRIPSKIIKVEKDFITTPIKVYSLKVEKEESYVADDIVTHNSIYQFRGATEDVVRSLQGYKLFNLDVNYRSNQEIIDFATTYERKARMTPITFSGQLESYKSAIFCEKGNGGTVYTLARTGAAYKVNEYLKEKGEKVVKDFLALNPMILCRKNKEVREIRELGWERVQTIHQAKGLEYDVVIVTDFEIKNLEDVNISYVGMTRARTHLMAANYDAFIKILRKLSSEGSLNNREVLF